MVAKPAYLKAFFFVTGLLVIGAVISGCSAGAGLIGATPTLPAVLTIPTHAAPTSTTIRSLPTIEPAVTDPVAPTQKSVRSSATPLLSPTPTITPSPTTPPTPTPQFVPQLGAPIGTQNFFRQEEGCNWQGIAGQVFDENKNSVQGLIVEINGELGGQSFLGLAITGSAPLYGAGGYEIKLSDYPLESNGTLWIVVKDLQGNILAAPKPFDTYQECEKNLVLFNFVTSSFVYYTGYFPIVSRSSDALP